MYVMFARSTDSSEAAVMRRPNPAAAAGPRDATKPPAHPAPPPPANKPRPAMKPPMPPPKKPDPKTDDDDGTEV